MEKENQIRIPKQKKKVVIKKKDKNNVGVKKPERNNRSIRGKPHKSKKDKSQELKKDQKRIGKGKYILEEEIGEGSTGKVYRAKHIPLNEDVALRILNPKLTKNNEAFENFRKEARIGMLKLSNRYILKTCDFGENGGNEGNYFICMEYAEKGSLGEVLGKVGPFELEQVKITIDSCSEALKHAHKHDIIHRDLKPSNILIAEGGVIKVADFGASLFKKGQGDYIRGTPAYMSPEQRQGKKIDFRTDIYSLGEIAYELLTGETRYPRNASLEEISKTEPGEVEGLPEPLSRVLKKATAKRKEDRFSDIYSFKENFGEAYEDCS